jgi:TonB-dependent SusC/RagA subfamily outer membrane receptor
MKTQESEVGNKSSINIALQEETIGLEEVVAIGYGTMKKVNLTGSISNVNAEELTTVPMPTIAQSIMGKASGVFVKNTNGQPGETEISFNIRGFGSPLLIIDGMPASSDDFKQLDPNDIKDFSVLKDAASAAVYGARAGNGVIVVTTKRGNVSEAKVTYTGNYGLQFFPVVPDFVSSEQYARMENLSRYNQGLDPVWMSFKSLPTAQTLTGTRTMTGGA